MRPVPGHEACTRSWARSWTQSWIRSWARSWTQSWIRSWTQSWTQSWTPSWTRLGPVLDLIRVGSSRGLWNSVIRLDSGVTEVLWAHRGRCTRVVYTGWCAGTGTGTCRCTNNYPLKHESETDYLPFGSSYTLHGQCRLFSFPGSRARTLSNL